MIIKSFIFSYKNILIREIEKKNYLSFLRKIFNLLYKFLINSAKKKFGLIINLDKQDHSKKINLPLEKLFEIFNSDKGLSFKTYDNQLLKSHNYTIFYEKYFKNLNNNKLRILEIGSHEGKGLAAFYYFFKNSSFVGANINPFQMKFCSKKIEDIYINVS